MKTFRLLPPSLILSLPVLLASPAVAQEVVQPLPGTTDADALAAEMRRVAANPRDVDALVDAARLSLKLDDLSAAASLLQRAENVDPRNPRVKAGQGSVLVQSERPGQALRYFAEAEGQGLDARSFAADRGLAYDLTGQQERAQRDYARALRDAPDDGETIRRYALSLGISGQRARALQLLDPLVRRSDRAAWRAQAFVLAMTGDIGGASRIAAAMMPGGAAGLSAFFERLPTLPAIDRAFAVHFGEVRATPERLADARLAPPLGSAPRDGGVALASAQPLPPSPARRIAERPVVAASPAFAPPTAVASVAPSRQASPVAIRSVPPVASVTPSAPAVVQARPAATLVEAREPAAGTRVSSVPPVTTTAPLVQFAAAQPVVQPVPAAAATAPATPAPAVPGASAPVEVVALPPSAPRSAPAARTPGTRASEDSILAKIIAGLSIPGSELGVAEPARAAATVAEPAPTPGRAEPAAPTRTDADRAAADRLAAADRIAAAQAAAEKKAADRKATADRKALAEKKAAAEKKAIADREAAEKKKAERANPERIWVQVAGGAYEGDLSKAYAAVKAKAPGVFGSRGGWTTPLRATNRVLAGPFRTDAEARSFVNDLKKQGVSAFTFTSDAGQPVTKLGGKGSASR